MIWTRPVFDWLSISTFASGLVSGLFQLAYLNRLTPYLSDLSTTSATVYLIAIPAFAWLILVGLSWRAEWRGRLRSLLSAPLLLTGPALILILFFSCSFAGRCP